MNIGQKYLNKAGGSPSERIPKPPERHFSDETLRSLQELGEIFRQIRTQLISEGYVIKDGQISKPVLSKTHDETRE
jgi:hypothetical protein